MTLPEALGEQLMNQVVGRVLDHLDFFEDHFLFTTDVDLAERRVHDDVGQHLDRQRQMLVEHLEVVAGVLLGREGVHLPPDGVDGLSDVFSRARVRPLEKHVLDEVRDAALLERFMA